jgi:hypothetical protein
LISGDVTPGITLALWLISGQPKGAWVLVEVVIAGLEESSGSDFVKRKV